MGPKAGTAWAWLRQLLLHGSSRGTQWETLCNPCLTCCYLQLCRAAFRRPKVRYSRDLEWLRSVTGQTPASSRVEHTSSPSPAAASALSPTPVTTRPRPRYWRDAFGPGVVIPLNIFLGWLLINADLINIRL